MIKRENVSNMIHIFSDEHLNLLIVETAEIVPEAYEMQNGIHYTYKEVERK